MDRRRTTKHTEPNGGEVQREHWQGDLAWEQEKAQARIELEANMRRNAGQACTLGRIIAYKDGKEMDAETCLSSNEDDASRAGLSPHWSAEAAVEAEAKVTKRLAKHAQSLGHEGTGLELERCRHNEESRDEQEAIHGL